MNKKNNLSKSISIIKDFIKVKVCFSSIDDFLDQLPEYNFHELYADKMLVQFGNNKSYEDGDCTKLAYAIYSIIWFNKMHALGITDFSENNFEKYKNSFSGDTINTFYTLFGKTSKEQNRVLTLLQFNEIEKEVFTKFKTLYQTIGNFYFLPKNTINRQSLNTYLGCVWGDFFDVFLKAIKEIADNRKFVNKEFNELFNSNRFFFDKIDSVNDFLNLFYLKDDEEGYNYLIDFDFPDSETIYRHTILTEKNATQYKRFVIDYMQKSNYLIEKRSKVLVRELKKEMKANGVI